MGFFNIYQCVIPYIVYISYFNKFKKKKINIILTATENVH